ncbi:MAG: CRISPR-associated protein Csx15 [Caldilineaceae bacterium]
MMVVYHKSIRQRDSLTTRLPDYSTKGPPIMLLLNFTHPLSPAQFDHLTALTGQAVERTLGEMVQFDAQAPLAGQMQAIIDRLALDSTTWQTTPIVVNLPGHNVAAAAMLAELHGRMGHFPAVVRVRPIADSAVTQYEIAEVINLQAMRERARTQR